MNSSNNKRTNSKERLSDKDSNNSKKIHLDNQPDDENGDLLNPKNNTFENQGETAANKKLHEPNQNNPGQQESVPPTKTNKSVGLSSFKGFKAYDKSIELVAKVKGFSGPSEVGQDKNQLYKVDLVNDRGEKLQLAVWNDEIKRITPFIKTNAILHIESVYCKPITKPKLNKGTENYELVVQSNTIIKILGHDNIESNAAQLQRSAPLIRIRNLLSCGHQFIRTTGFIKTTFGLIKTLNGRNQYICGSITDKHIKVEVRISNTDEKPIIFNKGDHICLKGSIQVDANPIYILVEKVEDITQESSEKVDFKDLINITEVLDTDSHKKKYDSDKDDE